MSMPSPFEMGRAIGGNISGGVRGGIENNQIDRVLQEAKQSGNPEMIKDYMGQILRKVSPEKRPAAIFELQQRLNSLGDTSTEEGYKSMMRQRGVAGQFESYASPMLDQMNISPEEKNRFFQASKQFENIPNLQERFAKTDQILKSQQASDSELYGSGQRPGLFGDEEGKIQDLQPMVERMKQEGFTDQEMESKLQQLGHGQVETEKMLYPMDKGSAETITNIGKSAKQQKDFSEFAASKIRNIITPKTSMLLLYENLLKSGLGRDQISKTLDKLIKANPNLTNRQLRQVANVKNKIRSNKPQQLIQKLDTIFGLKR